MVDGGLEAQGGSPLVTLLHCTMALPVSIGAGARVYRPLALMFALALGAVRLALGSGARGR